MADVQPFPLARRRDWISKQAMWFCAQPHAAAEKNLKAALDCQRRTMQRRGVGPDLIEAQLRAGESAIRSAIWAMVLTPEHTA